MINIKHKTLFTIEKYKSKVNIMNEYKDIIDLNLHLNEVHYKLIYLWLKKNGLDKYKNISMYVSEKVINENKSTFKFEMFFKERIVYRWNGNIRNFEEVPNSYDLVYKDDCYFYLNDKVYKPKCIINCYNDDNEHFIFCNDHKIIKMIKDNIIDYNNKFIIECNYYNNSDFIEILNRNDNKIIYMENTYEKEDKNSK